MLDLNAERKKKSDSKNLTRRDGGACLDYLKDISLRRINMNTGMKKVSRAMSRGVPKKWTRVYLPPKKHV